MKQQAAEHKKKEKRIQINQEMRTVLAQQLREKEQKKQAAKEAETRHVCY